MRYEEQLRGWRRPGRAVLESLQQIKSLNEMNESFSGRRRASRRPAQTPGERSWGRCRSEGAELAGMAPWCDFYEQVTVDTESGKLRPDMVVRLPNGASSSSTPRRPWTPS